MPIPEYYVPVPEDQAAKCDVCDSPTVIVDGHRIAPFWKDTRTGKVLCDDCFQEREE